MAANEVDLDGLLAEAGIPAARAAAAPGQAIASVSYTHDAMVDLLIARPEMSQNELAAHFGYTASWISRILASDAFKARYSERIKTLVDPVVMETVQNRFDALVLRSLDILSEKLNRPAKDVPDNLALRALELGSRAAGYGVTPAPAPSAPAEVLEHLQQIGGGLVQLLRQKKIESALPGVFEEVPS